MLYRPYIRKEVRQEVENRTQKNDKGQFLDANTQKPINGKYDLGHKPGHEFWREAQKAEKEGLTQKQFNNRMNNPDLYHIESPHENRSHSHEMPKTMINNAQNKGEKSAMERNEFLESIKADKATIDRCNDVSRNAAQKTNTQNSKSISDNGGMERGDSGPGSLGRESGNKSGGQSGHNSSNAEQSSSGQGVGGQGSNGQGFGGQGNGGHGSSGGGH